MKVHLFTLKILYLLTALSLGYVIAAGWDYYRLPLNERPYHESYKALKPGGNFGHGLGVIGGGLILLLFLYSARKRLRFMQSWGNIRYWLNYHIWMGVTGPLLIIFHTTFKVGGIVAVAFWSMAAVALSGMLGRYLYIQIPRSLSGQELTAAELGEQERDLVGRLRSEFKLGEDKLKRLEELGSAAQDKSRATGWTNMMSWIVNDLKLPFLLNEIGRDMRRQGALDRQTVGTLSTLVKRLALLRRRMVYLETAHRLLHYWHIIHKPFAIVMIVIVCIHVFVALLFGYTWLLHTA